VSSSTAVVVLSPENWRSRLAHWTKGEALVQHEDKILLLLTLIVGAVVGMVVAAFIFVTENLDARMYPAGGAAWRRVLIPTGGALITGYLLSRFFINAPGSGIPQTKAGCFCAMVSSTFARFSESSDAARHELPAPPQLVDTQVFMAGTSTASGPTQFLNLPLYYVSQNQVNAMVPYEVSVDTSLAAAGAEGDNNFGASSGRCSGGSANGVQQWRDFRVCRTDLRISAGWKAAILCEPKCAGSRRRDDRSILHRFWDGESWCLRWIGAATID
jgi:hypothetical protein